MIAERWASGSTFCRSVDIPTWYIPVHISKMQNEMSRMSWLLKKIGTIMLTAAARKTPRSNLLAPDIKLKSELPIEMHNMKHANTMPSGVSSCAPFFNAGVHKNTNKYNEASKQTCVNPTTMMGSFQSKFMEALRLWKSSPFSSPKFSSQKTNTYMKHKTNRKIDAPNGDPVLKLV
eukprot:TRINITY_DN4969_c0_g1_i4.p2 TRINITY_DN4969_c0_g1~~TRINITY_DN4969_c0_g1_i4.p2  ORF type:complete len:176 (-),score=36.49 TRINITY_DN4969_c0_g1_i4:868-1395(-)